MNRTFGFLLLLFFSLQMLGQELNPKPDQDTPTVKASSSSSAPSGSSSAESRSSSSGSSSSSSEAARQKAKEQALKEREREKAKAAAAAAGKSSSSSSSRPSGSSSSSSSSRPSGSSSSSSRDPSKKVVTGEAVREASGSKTVTGRDGSNGDAQPPVNLTPPGKRLADYQVGFGMHYIHTVQFGGALDCSGSRIPSEGPSHPLMTSLSSHLAN